MVLPMIARIALEYHADPMGAPDDLLSTSYLNYYELGRLYRGKVSNFPMLGGGGALCLQETG